jgi:hypothetical protein
MCHVDERKMYLQDFFHGDPNKFSLAVSPENAWRTTNRMEYEKKRLETEFVPEWKQRYYTVVCYEMETDNISFSKENPQIEFDDLMSKPYPLTPPQKEELQAYKQELERKYGQQKEQQDN